MNRRAKRILARDRSSARAAFLKRRRTDCGQGIGEDEIDRRIVNAILAAAIGGGAVSEADLRRADVPERAITKARFEACFARALEIDPALRTVEAAP